MNEEPKQPFYKQSAFWKWFVIPISIFIGAIAYVVKFLQSQ